tara:strand:- start:94 stop:852 length:759 start_codon:yes stop_codon:yes gene_type:complete
MCLDYRKVDLNEIQEELDKWIMDIHPNDINKKGGKTNPLNKHLKRYVHLLGPNMGSINTKHGQFIERNFHKWVQCIPNWDSILRPKINFQNKASGQKETKEIDNISFNKKTGQLLIFELKRNYDTKFSNVPRSQEIYDRLYLYNKRKKSIINQVSYKTGSAVKNCSIALINVYGQKKLWTKNVQKKNGYEPEVYTGNEIGNIFGQCLIKFMDDLNKYLIDEAFGSYSMPVIDEMEMKDNDNELSEFIKTSLN